VDLVKIYGTVEPVISLVAQNLGSTKVTFRSFPALLLPGGKRLIDTGPIWMGASFPCVLEPRDSVTVSMQISKLVKTLKQEGYSGRLQLTGLFQDALDKHHTSEPFDFDIDRWSKEAGS